MLVAPVWLKAAEMAPEALSCTFLCVMSSLLDSFAAPSGFRRRVWRSWFFAPFFLACSPSFCHRLPIIATQHLIYNAPQRMCTIEYIWHDIQGPFVALLLCKYSQKSSHSLVALPSSASTPAIVLTRRASKCKKWHCYTLIMIYRSVLIIWTTGMMRTEARIIVCMQKWCFRKVKAGCSPATKYLLL